MPPTDANNAAITAYLTAVQQSLAAGNATEHTYRPALKTLLEALAGKGVTATNEPKHIAAGAPDYHIARDTPYGSVTIGYVEAKDIGKLTPGIEKTDQLKRYLPVLHNFLLTDYLEFRWYVGGTLRETARLAHLGPGNKLVRDLGGADLLTRFLNHPVERITAAKDLAERMARLTHYIRDLIIGAFDNDQASPLLKGWRAAFAQVLIADLDQPLPEKTAEFADMFAQTLAYGLFSARIMDPTPVSFTRQEARDLIPSTNPFLRDFFDQISGPSLKTEPYGPFVDDLATLLANTDMDAVLANFGKRTRQEDPVVHFYETFLAAYDRRLREARGVYYTPEPVVSYLVRSVDHLLRTRFNIRDGLADSTKISIPNPTPQSKIQNPKSKIEVPRVLILDPATGTGTFLYFIIDHIRRQFMARNDAGDWSDYVRESLLPRLFAFELLMAPYAVAHFKLALQLAGRDLPPERRAAWAYDFATNERLGVYLTNTLEGPHEYTGLPLFTQFLPEETNAANRIKRDLPIMVVIGNPPYSGISSNMSDEIAKMVDAYKIVDGKPLGERKLWLQDDYVKFIRFGQTRIESTGAGILAFITNHGYLDNPTFRGMRQSLMQTFNDIYILNLHGNSKKKERSPDGSADENVFDIQQGVAIGIFIRDPHKQGPAQVHHADLWGSREAKYDALFEQQLNSTEFKLLEPNSPFYFFVPRTEQHRFEYEDDWQITSIIPTSIAGIITARDSFVMDFNNATLQERIADLHSSNLTDEEVRNKYFAGKGSPKYPVGDSRGWKLPEARKKIRADKQWEERIITFWYRPFDKRSLYYVPWMVDWPRTEIMRHMLIQGSLGFHICRQVISDTWRHVLVTDFATDSDYVSNKTRERGYTFPLYLYPDATKATLFNPDTPDAAPGTRRPNLNPAFTTALAARLALTYDPTGQHSARSTQHSFTPEDVFHYIYAIFHAPTYRARYAEFLKIDFPRVPLTTDPALFRALIALGADLVAAHLLTPAFLDTLAAAETPAYPVPGDHRVEAVRYTPPALISPLPSAEEHTPPALISPLPSAEGRGAGGEGSSPPGRVWINKTQYFEGVPEETWTFHIGGYQVAEKWLKDRKARPLTGADRLHYRHTLAALAATRRLMAAIDATIPTWPLP